MHSAVISDASCLIVLFETDALYLLRETYGVVTTTPEIASEIRFPLPNWMMIRSAARSDGMMTMPNSIDSGEASAIALALEMSDSILILDQRTARNYAKKVGLNVTGTLGVIVKAKLDGAIPSIRPFVEAVRKTDFRFSAAVEADAYRLVNEELK